MSRPCASKAAITPAASTVNGPPPGKPSTAPWVPRPTGAGSRRSVGAFSPSTRSTARSNDGSNSTTSVARTVVPTCTRGWAMPATTWALVTTRPGAATNPDPSWRTPHPYPSTLTVDRPGGQGGAAQLRVRRQGDRSGRRRRQGGQDRWEPFGGQESLRLREDRRRGRQHAVE